MKNIIKQILKTIRKVVIYTVAVAIAVSAILSIGYFLIPYLVKEHKEPKDFTAVLCDKIYESKLPEAEGLDYVVKKYGIKSIVFLNDNVSEKSAYIFQYINNNNLHHFFKSIGNNILPSRSAAMEFVNFVNAESNQPVLVCGANDNNNIDALMTVYRVGILNWEFDDAMSETKNHYNDEQIKLIKDLTLNLESDFKATQTKIQNTNDAISFVVLGDVHYSVWQEILRSIWRNCVKGQPVPASFVIGVGDMIHSKKLYLIYKKYFTAKKVETPIYLPVLGNHEEGWIDNGDEVVVRDEIIPSINSIVRYNQTTCNYYLDKKNTRFIAIDPYTDLGEEGVVNDAGRQWTENVITSAPENIKHIFVFFHEPAFPRVRHIYDSFDENPKMRNMFWEMLLKHKNKVRAVFCGHTHHYYKMKIADPKSKEANSPKEFPIQKDGIYQIDIGAAGRRHTLNETFVQTIVADNKITVNVFQRKRETAFSRLEERVFGNDKYSNMFRLIDKFQIYP